MEKLIGVWNDYTEGKIFVSQDYDKNSPFVFAMTLNDHTPNTMLINSAKKYNCFRTFINNFKMGNVYYENNKIKYIVQDLVKFFIIS